MTASALDWYYVLCPNLWRHPDTGVVIYAEDMPTELLPDPLPDHLPRSTP